MIDKLKLFLLEKVLGKMIARVAVTIASALATGPAQEFLAKIGISMNINDTEMAAGLISFGHIAFEWYKKRNAKKPEAASGSVSPTPPVAG